MSIVIAGQFRRWLSPVILFFVSYFAIVAGLWTAYWMRWELVVIFPDIVRPFFMPGYYINYLLPAVFLGFLAYEKMFTRRIALWESIGILFKVCTFSIGLVLLVLYLSRDIFDIPRLLVAFSCLFVFVFLSIFRYIAKRIMFIMGIWQIPVLIIGAGKTAELLVNIFDNDPNLGYTVVGLIEDNPETCIATQKPILGNFSEMEKILLESGVHDVIIATPGLSREALLSLVYRAQLLVRNVGIVPNLFGIPLGNITIENHIYQKALILQIQNNLARFYNRWIKLVFDFSVTLVGVTAALPVFLCICCLIYAGSGGPVWYAQQRVGKNGKLFWCYKFRTMIVGAEKVLEEYLATNPEWKREWEVKQKLENDPRITRVGLFLRKTSLDELPQLFNVLIGDMSLVGPRPVLPEQVELCGQLISDYYMVRPGVTGYWQVGGRNNTSFQERLEMDSWYVRNWSLWLDMVILMKTVRYVLSGKGGY